MKIQIYVGRQCHTLALAGFVSTDRMPVVEHLKFRRYLKHRSRTELSLANSKTIVFNAFLGFNTRRT